MAALVLDIPSAEAVQSHLAERLTSGPAWRRVRAFFFDLGLTLAISAIAFVALAFSTGFIAILIFPFLSVGYIAFLIFYMVLTLGGRKKATFGMRREHLMLQDKNGEPLRRGKIIWRAIAFAVSTALLTPLVLLIIVFTKGRLGLHDLLSGATMVDLRQGSIAS